MPPRSPTTLTLASTKRQRICDPVSSKVEQVRVALGSEAADLPEAVRAMLQAMLSTSLELAQEDRHSSQVDIVQAIGDVFTKIERKLSEQVNDAESKVERIDVERSVLIETLKKAQSTFEAKQAVTREAKERQVDDDDVLREAKAALARAETACEEHAKELLQTSLRRDELESIRQRVITPVCEGSLTDSASSTRIEELQKLLPDFEVEASLLSVLPKAARKPHNLRTTFDNKIVETLNVQVADALTRMGAALAESELEEVARRTSVEAAESAMKMAAGRLDVACEDLNAAREVEAEAKNVAAVTRKQVTSGNAEARKSQKILQRASDRICFFQEGPLRAFIELRDHTKCIDPASLEPTQETLSDAPGMQDADLRAVLEAAESI